jgi:hypothetical protein
MSTATKLKLAVSLKKNQENEHLLFDHNLRLGLMLAGGLGLKR